MFFFFKKKFIKANSIEKIIILNLKVFKLIERIKKS